MQPALVGSGGYFVAWYMLLQTLQLIGTCQGKQEYAK